MNTGVSKLAGVCGWPIHHSLSPLLHGYWLRAADLDGAYVHFAVRPDKAVRAFKSLNRTSITGVNVTLPLKGLAYEAADKHTSDAMKLGVANCLYRKNDKLIAHNTDMEGFAAPLLKLMKPQELSSARVVVFGTGGACRAVIGALLSMNVPEICVIGRDDEKSASLVAMVNVPSLYSLPWAERNWAVAGANVIVNASAGGMAGKPRLDVDLSMTDPGSLVYDLVYTPAMTPLLIDAQKQGCRTLGGLEMLIAQARPSFKLFFGVAPPEHADPRPILKAALEGRQ